MEQDARIALLNEYSSSKRSWAIVALTTLVAIFSLFQNRSSFKDTWFFYLVFGFTITQTLYSALRYVHYGQSIPSVVKSAAKNEEDCKRVDGTTYPYLYRLELGVYEDYRKKLPTKITYYLHGFWVWLVFSVIFTAIFYALLPIFF